MAATKISPATTTSSQNNITEKSSEAVKDVRRRIFARMRDDWAFDYAIDDSRLKEDVVLYAASEAEGASDVASDTASTTRSYNEDLKIVEWRERTYASSDPSSSEDEGGATAASSTAGIVRRRQHGTTAKTPEEEAAQQLKKEKRRQRRYARLNEEMSWNEGLRFFQARRDAWCCAKKEPVAPTPASKTTTTSSPSTATSSTQPADTASTADATSGTQPDMKYSPTLIPVHSPLIKSSDPSKSIISPNLYPSIYSKVVMQSLSPSVPINLSHLVGALVTGWKATDAWPPKASTPIASSNNQSGIPTGNSTIVSSALSGLGIGGRVKGWGKRMTGAAGRDKDADGSATNGGRRRKRAAAAAAAAAAASSSNTTVNGVPANGAGGGGGNGGGAGSTPVKMQQQQGLPALQDSPKAKGATAPGVAGGQAGEINHISRSNSSGTPPLPPPASAHGQSPGAATAAAGAAAGNGGGSSGNQLRKGVTRVSKVFRMSWSGNGSGASSNNVNGGGGGGGHSSGSGGSPAAAVNG